MGVLDVDGGKPHKARSVVEGSAKRQALPVKRQSHVNNISRPKLVAGGVTTQKHEKKKMIRKHSSLVLGNTFALVCLLAFSPSGRQQRTAVSGMHFDALCRANSSRLFCRACRT